MKGNREKRKKVREGKRKIISRIEYRRIEGSLRREWLKEKEKDKGGTGEKKKGKWSEIN